MANIRLLFIISVLTLTTVSGFAIVIGDTATGQYDPIETADDNPNVTEKGAYRLLASNDYDRDNTTAHPDIFNVSARSTQTRLAGNNSTQHIIRIDGTSFTVNQSREYSQMTDGYREVLYTDTRIPTNDSWQRGSDVTIENTDFIGFNRTGSFPQHSGEDGVVYVKIASEPGELPARNVNVSIRNVSDSDSSGELYISNPDEIYVYDGDMTNYDTFNRQVAENTFLNTGMDKSIVPTTGNGTNTARYDVHSETYEGKWHGNRTTIRDHYVGIIRITEGAIYDDYWIVNPDGINVTVITDFRANTPYPEGLNYTEDAPDCSYSCGPNGNETCYATPERYESYTDLKTENEFMEIYHNGTYHSDAGQTQVVRIDNPASGSVSPYSTITVSFTHTYGVDYPSECSETDWETTETGYATSAINQMGEHPIEPADASELNISAYVKNTQQGQEIYFDVVGDQRPGENPLASMQVTANGGQDVWKAYTPWIAFPQSLYNRVETREGYTSWENTSVKLNNNPHNLHRDYLDANGYKTSTKSTVLVNAETIDQNQTYRGINVGENVINTKGDVPLYHTYGGKVWTTGSGERLQNIDASATDMFGNTIDVETTVINYGTSDIHLEKKGDSDVIQGELVDSNGTGIANRTIIIDGGAINNTTTNRNGTFEAGIGENATIFTAEFEGDDFRDNVSAYYEESSATVTTGNLYVGTISTPMRYLSAFISNLLVVAHWIALGIFFVWWTKFRNGD